MNSRFFSSFLICLTTFFSTAAYAGVSMGELRAALGEQIWAAPWGKQGTCGDRLSSLGTQPETKFGMGVVVGVDNYGEITCQLVTFRFSGGQVESGPRYTKRGLPWDPDCSAKTNFCVWVSDDQRVNPMGVQMIKDQLASVSKRASPQPSPPASGRPAESSTPRLRGTGSSFAVNSSGLLITNEHVVKGCARIEAKRDNKIFIGEVIGVNALNDLALIQLKDHKTTPIRFAPGKISLGERVTVLGYPLSSILGSEIRVTEGIVNSLSAGDASKDLMQISAEIQLGNSGGPVLNNNGELVGVVVSKLNPELQAENVNFAIRLPIVRAFMELHDITPQEGKSIKTLDTPNIVRTASASTYLIRCFK